MKNLKKSTALVCLSLAAYCIAYSSAKIAAPDFQIVEVATGFNEACLLMGNRVFHTKQGFLACVDENSNIVGVSN